MKVEKTVKITSNTEGGNELYRHFHLFLKQNLMKNLALILFCFLNSILFGQNSVEYKYESIKIDSNLQLQKQDTLNIVKSKIKGTWQYYGIYKNGQVVEDTLSTTISLINGKYSEGTNIIRQGNIYLIDEKGETKLEKVDISNFDFENEDIFQTIMHEKLDSSEKWQFGLAYETKTCRSFYFLVYFDKQVGILVDNYFLPILKLESNILLLQSRKNKQK